jgi:Mce-associated membrane protein
MPTSTDSTTDESPRAPDEPSPPGDDISDGDELTAVSEDAEVANDNDEAHATDARATRVGRSRWKRMLAVGVLPALALLLAVGAGYLTWLDNSAALAQAAAAQSTKAATESTIAMLSYRPETVDKDLLGAANRMTGKFRDEYTQLIRDVVIPGAKQKKISSTATVPAAAPISATENHAVVLLFVDQAITFGDDPTTNSASTVRVTVDKVDQRWLISHFDPI